MNDAPAIPRLGVPAYEWWNEALHGVARAGAATVFPQAIGLAATFDTAADARGRRRDQRRGAGQTPRVRAPQGRRGRYQGLTFWSPNINIFRDPRWGRGQETYGEDPVPDRADGRRVREGAAGRRPALPEGVRVRQALRGPQRTRARPAQLRRAARASATCARRTCPPSGARPGGAACASVMGAYNRVNGESASASQRLLAGHPAARLGLQGPRGLRLRRHRRHLPGPQARGDQGGGGGAGRDARAATSSAGSVYKTLDGSAGQGAAHGEGHRRGADAGSCSTRMKLGLFDPPERVAYAQIPYRVNQSDEHDRLARRVAQSSLVLLKNDGLLPLSRNAEDDRGRRPDRRRHHDAARQLLRQPRRGR